MIDEKHPIPRTEIHNAVRSYIAVLIKALSPSATFVEEFGIEGRRADIIVLSLPTYILGPLAFLAGKTINVVIDVKTGLSKDKIRARGAQVIEYIADMIVAHVKMRLHPPTKERLMAFTRPEFKGIVIRICGFNEDMGYTGSPGVVLITPGDRGLLSKAIAILSPKGNAQADEENIKIIRELVEKLKEEGNIKLASELVKKFSQAIDKVLRYLFPAAGVDPERIRNIKAMVEELVNMAFLEGMFKRESPGSVSTLLEYIPRPKVETLRKLLLDRALLVTSVDEAKKLLELGLSKRDLLQAIASGAVLPEVIPDLVLQGVLDKKDLLELIEKHSISREVLIELVRENVLDKRDLLELIRSGSLSPSIVKFLIQEGILSREEALEALKEAFEKF